MLSPFFVQTLQLRVKEAAGAAPGLDWAAGAKHVPGAMPHTARVQQPPAADGNF